MKKIFIVLVLLGQAVLARGFSPELALQLSDIEDFVSVEGNYHSLLERMYAGDRTLSLEQYAYLYYGFSFTDNYVHGVAPLAEMGIMNLAREERIGKAWELCREVLLDNPFSMYALNLAVYLADAVGDPIGQEYYDRSENIRKVIEATGDGSKEYPYQIVSAGDALYYIEYQIAVAGVDNFNVTDEGWIDVDVVTYGAEIRQVSFAQDLCNKKGNFPDFADPEVVVNIGGK